MKEARRVVYALLAHPDLLDDPAPASPPPPAAASTPAAPPVLQVGSNFLASASPAPQSPPAPVARSPSPLALGNDNDEEMEDDDPPAIPVAAQRLLSASDWAVLRNRIIPGGVSAAMSIESGGWLIAEGDTKRGGEKVQEGGESLRVVFNEFWSIVNRIRAAD